MLILLKINFHLEAKPPQMESGCRTMILNGEPTNGEQEQDQFLQTSPSSFTDLHWTSNDFQRDKNYRLASSVAVSSWNQNAGTAWWAKALEKERLA